MFLHWHSGDGIRISHTAIAANLSKQGRATIPVTHYFDTKRVCRDCRRPFLFFAEEQRHWYEELGFPLEADCVHCAECRRQQHGLARARERYEELFHVVDRSWEQDLEMLDCCISLLEAEQFHPRQAERARAMLKRLAASIAPEQLAELERRLEELESKPAFRASVER